LVFQKKPCETFVHQAAFARFDLKNVGLTPKGKVSLGIAFKADETKQISFSIVVVSGCANRRVER